MPIASMTAGMVASTPTKSIDESASIEEAANLMKREKIKRIPVTNNGQLVGIISDIDIVFEVPKMIKMMEEVCREK
jgi:CBS domain-containing protein